MEIQEAMEADRIVIRREKPEDYREIENMVREAFWDVYRPGCCEHLVIHNLRKSPAFIRELALVACAGERVVGVAVCPRAAIKNAHEQESQVLSMVLGVLPSFQKKGIGSALVQKISTKARELGFKGIVIFGNPEYYRRFGFKNAGIYGIQTADGVNMDPFMALELSADSLGGVRGRFYEDTAYDVQPEELEMFEKTFPYKEKHATR
jgi:predicted N-acetyltransferase YhbS